MLLTKHVSTLHINMTLLANVPAREVIFVEYIFSSVLKKEQNGWLYQYTYFQKNGRYSINNNKNYTMTKLA